MAARVSITELLSYRLHRVANGVSRSAALRYRREFGVSLGEWRTIALLGAESPQTVNQLARLAGLDKGQMSRVLSKLTERNIVSRTPGAGRSTQLTLTPEGQDLYESLIRTANERNRALLECLSPRERQTLDSALEKLGRMAKTLEQLEQT